MARLTWDAPGERKYEIGVDRGVFYKYVGGAYMNGIAWNGLTGVDDDTGGRDATTLYSGGVKMRTERTLEEYSGKIKCYTYPDELEDYLGETQVRPGVFIRQQDMEPFGFCYRSLVGNDTEGQEAGYRLHLIYNMFVTDFSRSYSTINSSNDLDETEISFESIPYEIDDENYDPVSEAVLDSRLIDSDSLTQIEEILYGGIKNPRLPFPDEIMKIIDTNTNTYPEPPEWYLYPGWKVYPAINLYPYSR